MCAVTAAKTLGLGAVSDVQAENVLGDSATLRALFFPTRIPSKPPRTPAPTPAEAAAKTAAAVAASESPEQTEAASEEGASLPLFVLKWQPPLVPGLSTKFKIFEPRCMQREGRDVEMREGSARGLRLRSSRTQGRDRKSVV